MIIYGIDDCKPLAVVLWLYCAEHNCRKRVRTWHVCAASVAFNSYLVFSSKARTRCSANDKLDSQLLRFGGLPVQSCCLQLDTCIFSSQRCQDTFKASQLKAISALLATFFLHYRTEVIKSVHGAHGRKLQTSCLCLPSVTFSPSQLIITSDSHSSKSCSKSLEHTGLCGTLVQRWAVFLFNLQP